jgi:hypothetical protein
VGSIALRLVHIVYEKYRDQRSKDYHAKLSYKCIDRVPTLVLQPPVARSKCTFVYWNDYAVTQI